MRDHRPLRVDRKVTIEKSLGRKYGLLTVIEFFEFRETPSKRKIPIMSCVCDCGKLKKISLWDLNAGKTKSCGFDHPHYKDRSEPAFNQIYNHSYRNRAIKKGVSFDISKEEFRELCKKACHYCGTLPENVSYRPYKNAVRGGRVKSGNGISEWIYNGLDRIDSDGGYTLDNVVTCCGICNHAKHTMSYEDFVSWLDKVAMFRR